MTDFILSGQRRIDYTIVRRSRKTVGIAIDPKQGVVVSAPGWVSKDSIRDIVSQKASWIIDKLEQCKDKGPGRQFVDGESLPLLGEMHPLKVNQIPGAKTVRVSHQDSSFIAAIPSGLGLDEQSEVVRMGLEQWFKRYALKLALERIAVFSKILGSKPSKVSVRGQKTRWGSCSSRKSININWKIAMLPMDLVDYIIVHELSHLKEMNHSRDFWSLVGSVLPDYKARIRLLKEYARKLDF